MEAVRSGISSSMESAGEWGTQAVEGIRGYLPATFKGYSARSLMTALLGGAVGLVALLFLVFKEEKLSFSQLPASVHCADPQDVLDLETSMCQATNPWALAYLRHQGFAVCPSDMPGLSILAAHSDHSGSFWYPVNHKDEVAALYRNCRPVCATEDDYYRSDSKMCHVQNEIARMWLEGQGQYCKPSAPGASILKQHLAYHPSQSKLIRQFYATCHATCAVGDGLLPDGRHCRVNKPSALNFFRRDGKSRCSPQSSGMDAISNTRDGGYYYPKSHGPLVEAWYKTCTARGGGGGVLSGHRQAQSEIMFPYPKEQLKGMKNIVICNYSGKTWYYSPGNGGDKIKIKSMAVGDECATVLLTEACADKTCWNRGRVAPCKSDDCFENSAKEVNAGISVVPGAGGSSKCTALCTTDDDYMQCKLNTVVHIAPAHCSHVKVLPYMMSKLDSVMDFPKPYNHLPKVTFPYPKAPDSTSIYLCNYSGEDFWFSTGDSTHTEWKYGPKAVLIKPLSRGGSCTVIRMATASWERGYIAPCADGEHDCFREKAVQVAITPGFWKLMCRYFGYS